MDQLLKCQWILRICSKISKNNIHIYLYYIYIYMCVCASPRVRLHFWAIHLHFFLYHWQPSNTRAWYRYVSRAPGVALRLWSWSVFVDLGGTTFSCNNLFHTFIRVSRMVNHQHAPATNHWFRKCIYSWMWGCFEPFPSNVLAPKKLPRGGWFQRSSWEFWFGSDLDIMPYGEPFKLTKYF